MESNRQRVRRSSIFNSAIAGLMVSLPLGLLFPSECAFAGQQTWQQQQPSTNQETTYTASQLYQLAANAYAQQDWQQAADYFRKIDQEHGSNELAQSARFYLAESLMQTKDYLAAEKAYLSYQAADENRDPSVVSPAAIHQTRVWFRLAECRYLLGDYQGALAKFERLHKKLPQDPLAEFVLPFLGELYLRNQQPQQAADKFQQALDRFPNAALSNKTRLGLAQAFQALGDFSNAKRFYQFLTIQTQEPLAKPALLSLGKMFLSQSEWALARAEFEIFERRFPRDARSQEVTYGLAKCDIGEEKFESAWQRLEPLLEKEWDDEQQVNLWVDAGLVAYQLDNLDQANRLFERVRSKETKWDELILATMVEIADRKNAASDLVGLATEFQARFPESDQMPPVLSILAKHYYAKREFQAASETYHALLALPRRGDVVQANQSSWRYLLGLAELGQERYGPALQQLVLIEDFRGDATFEAAVMVATAAAYVGQEKYRQAIPCYLRYLKLTPDSDETIEPRCSLVVAYAKENQLAEAAAQVKQLLPKYAQNRGVLQAIEILAEAAVTAKNVELANQLFATLSQASDTEIAARGTTGLVWTSEQSESSQWQQSMDTVLSDSKHREAAVEALLAKAQQLQAANKPEESVLWLRKILDSAPESEHAPSAMLRLALLLKESGQQDELAEASRWLDKFAATYSEHPLYFVACYERAWAYQALGNDQKAEQAFQIIADEQPTSRYYWDAIYRVAMAAQQSGNQNEAIKQFERLVVPGATHAFVEHALYGLGESAVQASDWENALTHFQQLVQRFPHGPLVSQGTYWLAESYFQTSAIQQAEVTFKQLVSSPNENVPAAVDTWLPTVFLRLAQCAAAREDWSLVASYAQESNERYPEHPAHYKLNYLLARVAISRADFRHSRELLQIVLADPQAMETKTAAMAQWLIGESYFHQDNLEQALMAYQLVDATYDYPEWRALALLQIIKCQQGMGHPKRASKTLQRLLKDFPDTDAAKQAASIESAPTKRDKHRRASFSN